MTAQIIYGVDFKNKKRESNVVPFDFAAMEAEIAASLWNVPQAFIFPMTDNVPCEYLAPTQDPA